jgi:hypothetical protein
VIAGPAVTSASTKNIASHLLGEALDGLRPEVAADAPLALLACPPGEMHELPLRFVRLVLENNGWRTELYGASLAPDDLQRTAERVCVDFCHAAGALRVAKWQSGKAAECSAHFDALQL